MDSLTKAALLNQKTYVAFDGSQTSKRLPELCLELLAEQKKMWPLLREGYQSIERCRERRVSCKGFSVLLQQNSGRMKSTLAAVGEQDVNKRACFLCLGHLPENQKGVLYRGEYLILCNPMPVFSAHLTIAHIDHHRQAISGQVDTFLRLMADFGSGWTLLYNGPKCGASAPDHFHLQAVPSGQTPIEKEIQKEERLTLMAQKDGVIFYRAKDVGREVIILEGDNRTSLGQALTSFLHALRKVLRVSEEPMINVIGLYDENRVMGRGSWGTGKTNSKHSGLCGRCEKAYWRLLIFPRRKHRPNAFFRKGAARVAVSPAVIEMGGVLVTPFARDFERLDATAVESIYREVSLEGKSVESAIHAILASTVYSTSS